MTTKGERVLYVLSADDAEKINRRRTDGPSIAQRIREKIWPMGAQAHVGNTVKAGATFPGIVVEDWRQQAEASGAGLPADPAVNLQVFLDGSDTFWATSRFEDGGKFPSPGTWSRLNQ